MEDDYIEAEMRRQSGKLDPHSEVTNLISIFDKYFKKEAAYLSAQRLHDNTFYNAHVYMNFWEVAKLVPDLNHQLLERPDKTLPLFAKAWKDFLGIDTGEVKVRFTDLSTLARYMIKNLRDTEIGKLISIEGHIRQKTDVRPKVKQAVYECVACGVQYPVLEKDGELAVPKNCVCKMRGKLNVVSEVRVDTQRLVLEDLTENDDSVAQPKRLNLFLEGDLVSTTKESLVQLGSRVTVVGILRTRPKYKNNVRTADYDIYLEVHSITPAHIDFSDVKFSPEEEKEILQTASRPDLYKYLIRSFAPQIYGHDEIKMALIHQIVGGVRKTDDVGNHRRGDSHIILLGDPGVSKTFLLKRVAALTPKSRYASGKSTSGVGLTAAVVKDEVTGEWCVEAGAVVLSHRSILCLDEIEKMNKEDTSALHEALESQCYTGDLELTLGTGENILLKDFVDRYLDGDMSSISIPAVPILTTNMQQIELGNIIRVNKKKAPDLLYKISFYNGRDITVTPDHPVFIDGPDGVRILPAEEVKEGMFVPIPTRLPLIEGEESAHGVFLGLLCSEGYTYRNNRMSLIGICNTDERIRDMAISTMSDFCGRVPNINILRVKSSTTRSKQATKDLYEVRMSNKEKYNHLKEIYPELMEKQPTRRIPQKVKTGSVKLKRDFIRGFFLGDGYTAHAVTGFSTSSIHLAHDLQQVLLNLGIYSNVRTENRGYHKVNITGQDSLEKFFDVIEEDAWFRRVERVRTLVQRSQKHSRSKDIIPHCYLPRIRALVSSMHLDDGKLGTLIKQGQNAHRKSITTYLSCIQKRIDEAKKLLAASKIKAARKKIHLTAMTLAKEMGCHYNSIYNYEARGMSEQLIYIKRRCEEKINYAEQELRSINNRLYSDIKSGAITKVEKLHNHGEQWVYDITVDKNSNFISNGLVLHNCLTLHKATVHATLVCETTVLAAANPKMGRFDIYKPLAAQTEMPPSLLNRFDLIFMMLDSPEPESDKIKTEFILGVHNGTKTDPSLMPVDKLKRYLIYAKKKFSPVLTPEVNKVLQDYYLSMRKLAKEDQETVVIPISVRQLEGLVRLAEASAKLRLSHKVEIEDAERAIALVNFSLKQIGTDPDTGKIDIDRLGNETTSTERNRFRTLCTTLGYLQKIHGNEIPYPEILHAMKEKGIDGEECNTLLHRLSSDGTIIEVRKGYYKYQGS